MKKSRPGTSRGKRTAVHVQPPYACSDPDRCQRAGYRQGDILRLDAVMKQINGSRALAREVLQALQHKGMVTLKTRVGATVQPMQGGTSSTPTLSHGG